MASFLKKLVEGRSSRSKSPTKQVRTSHNQPYMPPYNPHQSTYGYGTLPVAPYPHNSSNDYVSNTNYGNYGGSTGYLTSPAISPIMRNSSRISAQNSNQSNESFAINSWNVEKEMPLTWTDLTRRKKDNHDSTFYLSNKGEPSGANYTEPTLFMEPSSNTDSLARTRSHSPRKEHKRNQEEKPSTRSKSPEKRKAVSNTLDYLNSQCHLEGCSAAIVVHSTRFLICRHQLCHASEYFKHMLMTHRNHGDIHVAVSGMNNPSPTTQFRWFVESSIPCPALKDINDDTLETCMRLARRFFANGLEVRCAKFIIENAHSRQPIVALCWLNWCLKHKFEPQVIQACMPSVARLSLVSLEQHRHMMTEKVFADILAAKLRGCYQKAVVVFRTIHRMDHFSVDLDRCPKCGRTKDGLRVRVNADPCRKQLGCDRCHQEGCEIENKAGEDLQAFYQCPHALLPLNDSTDECHCQVASLAAHLGSSITPMSPDLNRIGRSPERRKKGKREE